MTLTPPTRRRLRNFMANRRGFWSLWTFLALFVVSLCAEVIANDRPLLVRYAGAFYLPVGVGAYFYSGGNAFWITFVLLGMLAIGTTLFLGRARTPSRGG